MADFGDISKYTNTTGLNCNLTGTVQDGTLSCKDEYERPIFELAKKGNDVVVKTLDNHKISSEKGYLNFNPLSHQYESGGEVSELCTDSKDPKTCKKTEDLPSDTAIIKQKW